MKKNSGWFLTKAIRMPTNWKFSILKMMLWLLANHNYSQAKKRKIFEKQFTAKVNTWRDKAITEKKGFTNLVRNDLKMSDWKVWQFCYWLARGIHFFNVQRLCYRNCSPFFHECKGTPILLRVMSDSKKKNLDKPQ